MGVPVLCKHSGVVIREVEALDRAGVIAAIDRAVAARQPMAALPAWRRKAALLHCVDRFQEDFDQLVELTIMEAGKVLRDARAEVERLIHTFTIAAEETTRINGVVLPMDLSPHTETMTASWKRVPIGPVALITPFNFPLNLVAHKLAPALAAGCPCLVKPSEKTPLGALAIGQILAECDLPEGAVNILTADRSEVDPLIEDERIALLSFTGSDQVGWKLKARAGRKSVVLELGGNAAVLVDEHADLDHAAQRIVFGAFYQAGQSCISVQRVLIHADIYDDLKARLITATQALRHGDPRDPATELGPLIDEAAAERVMAWIEEACLAGGQCLVGGTRQGTHVTPTILESVPDHCQVIKDEVFGPVMVLERYEHFEDGLARINHSRFGLQAGIFTHDIRRIQAAWDQLEVGAVIINDIPSVRADHMPYGGVKDSGLGREGIRHAIEHMTELRLLAIRH